MITVSASKFRNHLFDYLEKAAAGETIVIQHKKKSVARLVAHKQENWREKMTIPLKINVSHDELIEPIEDIWEENA